MDGPEGVSEANHPVPFSPKSLDSSFRWNDEQEFLAVENP